MSVDILKCEPTVNLTFGPLWFPNHPIIKPSSDGSGLSKICRTENDGRHYVASNVLHRSIQQLRSVELRLHGQVRDASTCKPVPNAIVDIWQTSSMGTYSTTADGDCRGAVVADSEGHYDLLTHLPGSYGVTGGVGYHTFGFELPPYSLRHIHVAVFAEGYDVLSTQLTFPNDVTADFRELLGGAKLTDPSVVLKASEVEDGSHEATFDFVILPNANKKRQNLFYNTSTLRDLLCPEHGVNLDTPVPLCHDNPQMFFNVAIPGMSLLMVLILVGCPLLALRWIVGAVLGKKKEKKL